MKKITFLIVLLAFFFSWYGTAQITSFPYSEDFESGAGGWVANNGSNGTWALGAPTATVINGAASGTNAWATNLSGNYNVSENSNVQSPVFDLTSLSAPSIQFSLWWDAEFSWDGMVLQSSINSGASWQNVGAFGDPNNWYTDNSINSNPGGQQVGWSGSNSSNNGSNGWVVARHALTGLAGQSNVIFRFAFGSDTSVQDNGVAFDLVSIFDVLCPEPIGIAVAGQTATTANISWTPGLSETTWEVVVQPEGTGVPSGSGVTTSSNSPYIAMGLNPITVYEVYVRSDCGVDGFSSWAGPANFTTLCSVFTPDYLATFDTFLQDCWEAADNGNPSTGPTNLGSSSWFADGFANNGFTGANNINLWLAEKNDWLISPFFDLTGGPFQVELDFAVQQFGSSTIAGTLGSDDQVQLLITTDNGATWIPLNVWNNTTPVPSGGQHYVYNLAAFSGQTVQFAVWASEGTVDDSADNDISFDNFEVRNVPTCPEPSALAATNITVNSAELSWTENGTATTYNIEIVTTGTAPTGVPTATGVSNPYLATGLSPITSYDFYVQADCGALDGLSSWEGPFTFITLCDVFVPDYLATFDTFLQDCWEAADNGNPSTGPTNLGSSAWFADGFANNGFTGANSINLWLAEKNDWLLSPLFDLTGGPFQVELDFAVMQFASSTNAGTLGSDDQVQLLITTDNGATWIPLNIWNNTTPVPAGGQHYVYNLAAFSGQTVQFAVWASEGTVDDDPDNEISFDNFQVRNVPTCPEPSALTSNNLSLTSTEVGWTENGGANIWNIEYGVSGFTQGTGTVVIGVTTNPYVLTNLTSDTLYQFYVQADCGAVDGLSSWTGPSSFYTGYCASIPSSNDGEGVTNVTIGITDFPSFGDVTYENHTATSVNAFQGVETNVSITFATGFTYDTNIWIDFNDNLIFETSEIVFQGVSTNANPTILDATFTMPANAALGQHRMRIGTADFGQVPPDPCFNGFFGVTLDFTINILVLDCVLPESTFTTIADCAGNQFFIDVDVTSLGDATSLEISNNFDANTTQALTVDTYQIGPFAFGTIVKVFVMNEQNNNCVISSANLGLLGCPPANDNCDGAIVAVVNPGESCINVTAGTILAASPSVEPPGSCTGVPNDDVWFQFTAVGAQQIIQLQNFVGGTTDLNHAVYSGVCGSLVELYCSDNIFSVTPNLTVGNTYFVRVFSAGIVEETTTFDLCIQTLGNPTYCLEALPICASDLQYPSIVGDDVAPPYLDYVCLFSQPDPTWNSIYFDLPGDYTFTLAQTGLDGSGNDIDFIIWGPFNSQQTACFDLIPSNIADCSYSPVSIETIELNNVQAGDVYVILITNFSQEEGFYTFTQASGPTNGTNCEIVCDVVIEYQDTEIVEDPATPGFGAPINLCGFESITLTANSPYADFYEWYLDGFAFSNDETVTITQSGVYQVLVNGDVCEGNSLSIQVPVIFGQEPVANTVADIVTCDDTSGDGFEAFDLESQTATILGDQDTTLFNVTYHLSQSDANTNTGSLSTPYTNISNPQTIYVRVEDANATFCSSSTSFNLVISGPTPTATSADIALCDDTARDGFESFNLAANDVNILNGQNSTDFAVSYYLSEADANAGTSPLTSTYTSTSNPQIIWARVENVNAVDCFAVVDFDLMVDDIPVTTFTTDFEYEVCPNATEPIIITATPQNYNTSEVSIVWLQDGVVIDGESGLTLPVLTGGFYEIQVTYNDTGCPADTVGVTVVQLDNCIIPQGISPDGDGLNDTFDLTNFNVTRLEIYSRLGRLVYSRDNYTNEWFGQTDNGDELPVGTYFYTMVYEGGTKTKSSWVYINK